MGHRKGFSPPCKPTRKGSQRSRNQNKRVIPKKDEEGAIGMTYEELKKHLGGKEPSQEGFEKVRESLNGKRFYKFYVKKRAI